MDDLNVWGVNWIDGMLVTSKHLNQSEDFAQNLNRAATMALSPGYGLAKAASVKAEPLELGLRRSGNSLLITVQKCTAVLPNGSIVNINEEFLKHKAVELKYDVSKEKRERIPLFLYAAPNEKTSFGDPLAGEQLSRHPYQVNKIALSIGPSSEISATAGLQIAEIKRDGDDYILDEAFVPAIMSTTCGKAALLRMEQLRKLMDNIHRAAVAAIAEVRMKTKSKPSAAEEETIRGVFLQSENILHNIGFNYNQIFDNHAGVDSRTLINYFTGLVGGFQQGFLIYPELREYVRNAQVPTDKGEINGGNILPELRDYQTRSYGYEDMTQFFDDSERVLSFLAAILSYYASGAAGKTGDSIERDGHRFLVQHHGAVKYSFRNNRHNIIIDGVDPRGTEDVIVKLHKKVLPMQYAANVIIYLGANEVDDIAAASVARKPVEDVADPDYWLIQPNEYFPLKSNRLDRLNIIIDGDVDRSALEAVKMNHVSIFSRSR